MRRAWLWCSLVFAGLVAVAFLTAPGPPMRWLVNRADGVRAQAPSSWVVIARSADAASADGTAGVSITSFPGTIPQRLLVWLGRDQIEKRLHIAVAVALRPHDYQYRYRYQGAWIVQTCRVRTLHDHHGRSFQALVIVTAWGPRATDERVAASVEWVPPTGEAPGGMLLGPMKKEGSL